MCVCGAPWVIKMAIIKVISQDSRLFTRPSVFSFLTYVFAYIYIYIFLRLLKRESSWDMRNRRKIVWGYDRGGIRTCFEDGRGIIWSSVYAGSCAKVWWNR